MVIAIAGCASPKAAPIAANASVDTVETANRELARSLELDYVNPTGWSDNIYHRTRAIEIFKRLCHTGNRGTCLLAAALSEYPDEALNTRIAANCDGGDELSCRYVHPAAANALSTVELRRGCAAGVLAECRLLVGGSRMEDVRYGAERSCLLRAESCEEAAETYFKSERTDPMRARFLLEVRCQSWQFDTCKKLATAYLHGDLAEPVFGRGETLRRFLCDPEVVQGEYCPNQQNAKP